MITKGKAQRILFVGYLILVAGFVLGLNTEVLPEMLLSALFVSYMCWSLYFGWMIVNGAVSDFFRNMIVFEENFYILILKYLHKKIFILIMTIVIAFLVGFCGGAVYKQLSLSRIAYF